MEFDFLQGLLASLKKPEDAVTKLNDAVALLGRAKLTSTDVHTGLWTLSAFVLRGGHFLQ